MSLNATARSIPGTLRQEVVIGGQHRLITDEPRHVGGDESGPAPHELVPAALAACVSTTLVMYARMKEWRLDEACARVESDGEGAEAAGQLEAGSQVRARKVKWRVRQLGDERRAGGGIASLAEQILGVKLQGERAEHQEYLTS